LGEQLCLVALIFPENPVDGNVLQVRAAIWFISSMFISTSSSINGYWKELGQFSVSEASSVIMFFRGKGVLEISVSFLVRKVNEKV